jgi:aminoglycoside phosphotransferase family enzyme
MSISSPAPGPPHPKLAKQKRETLANLNEKISHAYHQASNTHDLIQKPRNIVELQHVTSDECEELEKTCTEIQEDVDNLRRAADDFRDMVQNLFGMVLRSRDKMKGLWMVCVVQRYWAKR